MINGIKYWLICILCTLVISLDSFSQEVAYELPEILRKSYRLRAKTQVEEMARLLSKIGYTDDASIVDLYIENTVNSASRIFTNDQAYIVYDLSPANQRGQVNERGTIINYLTDFQLQYTINNLPEDEDEFDNVEYTGIETSHVKTDNLNGNYYVRVKFTRIFKGSHSSDSRNYSPVERIAQVEFGDGTSSSKGYISSVIFSESQDTTVYFKLNGSGSVNVPYQDQLKAAQKFYAINEYRQALDAYKLANEIVPTDSIQNKINQLDGLLKDINITWSIFDLDDYNNYINRINSENPDAYYKRGLEYLNRADYVNALADFEKALSLAPNYYQIYLVSAESYKELKNYSKATEILEKAWSIYPADPSLLVQIADLAAERDDLSKAERYLEQAVNFQDSPSIKILLGKIKQRLNKHNEAIEIFQSVVATTENNAEAHYHLGLSHLELVSFSLAGYHFDQAISVDESYRDSVLVKAEPFYLSAHDVIAGAIDRKNDAMNQLKIALILLPDYAEADNLLSKLKNNEPIITKTGRSTEELRGDNLMIRNEFEEALSAFENATERFPNDPRLFVKIGLAHFNLGNLDEAMEFADKTLKINKNSADANVLKSKILLERQEQFYEAKFLLMKAIKEKEQHPRAHYELFLYFKEFEDSPKQADKHLETAKLINPNIEDSTLFYWSL